MITGKILGKTVVYDLPSEIKTASSSTRLFTGTMKIRRTGRTARATTFAGA